VKIRAVSPFNAGINSANLLSLALSIAFLSKVFLITVTDTFYSKHCLRNAFTFSTVRVEQSAK